MHRKVIAITFVIAVLFSPVAELHAQDKIRDLVVKIHAVHSVPDVVRPWTKNTPQHVTGSGVVIDGKRILTNAHVVRYASQIYVQPNQSAERIPAHVVAMTPSMDLAVLKLEDESFFDNRGSLPFAEELPRVKDAVSVYGYPTGGSELSVTQGIVSRIEFADYYYQGSGLRIQVDAALNFGNSGGPAVTNGKLVGLVFSLIQNAQNIGYLIPVEEIKLFLADIADGVYDGKPQMNDLIQTIENGALRQKLKLPRGTHGVMVTEPYRNTPDYPLKEWDVITKIGNTAIDDDGKVEVRYDLRLSFLYLVQKFARNGVLPLTVFRNGRFMNIQYPVQTEREMVIPYLMTSNPRYFILGPLVFSPATQEYLERTSNQRPASFGPGASPLVTRRYDKPAFPGEELIVVSSPMFPDRITNGYDDPIRSVLGEVNGIPVKNLRHLMEIVRDSQEPEITLKFTSEGVLTHETMVFRRADLLASTDKILEENGIRSPYSADLDGVWNAYAARETKSAQLSCCVTADRTVPLSASH
jgi:S1-C subfamily serine protease